jgi:hypothetical protein
MFCLNGKYKKLATNFKILSNTEILDLIKQIRDFPLRED